ncbi:MAG: lysophospholipid acyltransferase family protein [Bacteroidota bacterium]|nr:lysophospholipid acyltransferase family protein [Bacteroidota bacterium]
MMDTNNSKKTKKKVPVSQILVSCYFWFTLFFIAAVMFPFALLVWTCTFLFDSNRKILHRFTCFWSDITLNSNLYWKVRIRGREKIQKGVPYVMVSNHQSGADIMVLFKLHRHFKWVAKKELFYVPFIGWAMALNRYIPIIRSEGRSKLTMMDRAKEAIGQGNSVIIFPEGTRTRDGHIQPFKSGAFRLAIETGAPVLPIVVKGTFVAIKKGEFLIYKNKNIEAVILDPISTKGFTHKNIKELMEKTSSRIREELEK